ncbi:hypothetical protein ONS95_009366 [Cadophora gregata]|uniref:uncharacterized protein n=1 Tax=Cadophora gregata TaxID=51156 RepID=UPI0026DCEEC7|nr:uncharacterized protein ONS95_009366 [Cadophora gregata]KAK0124405.1 hypothetical protein ONS95_009366 [Cadophora gregata]KAK0129743.1 hypothetical protein ONS96_000299 [Cadophora gregata f. sp. sojae]
MAVQRPSPHQFLEMMSGEKIKIYIGQEEKLYLVPRALICYYSGFLNTHFTKDVCIRQASTWHKAKWAKNNAKHLYDCQPEQFDMLLECMIQGAISKRWTNSREAIEKCMALVEYSGNIDMGDLVCEAVLEPLRQAIKNPARRPPPSNFNVPRRDIPQRSFTEDEIKVVFNVTKTGNALRALVAQDVLSREGLKGTTFEDAENNVPGFAAEVLKQFRKSASFWVWTDPINGLQRTFDGYS